MSGKAAVITIISICLILASMFGAFKKDRVVDYQSAHVEVGFFM